MKRVVLPLLVVVTLIPATLIAQSVHLKGGANSEPLFVDLGLALQSAGAISGLGNGDVLVLLTARADVTSVCQNQGGNQAPGQNPAPITVLGGQAIPEDELKNGTTLFNVTTLAPAQFIPGAPDCPNTNWDEIITDLSFTSAVLTVQQPIGNTVLTVSCTFVPATADGGVPRADVECN